MLGLQINYTNILPKSGGIVEQSSINIMSHTPRKILNGVLVKKAPTTNNAESAMQSVVPLCSALSCFPLLTACKSQQIRIIISVNYNKNECQIE